MIFIPLGFLILGGLIYKYGAPLVDEYLLFNLENQIGSDEFCQKCNIPTNLNYIHCKNCNICHSESYYKNCHLCDECIYINEYNSHTKKICTHKFN
mgnify:CR=1 FL=1